MISPGRDLTDLLALGGSYDHDAPCDEALLSALARAIERRRIPGDPPAPALSGLRVRREGLPAWWTAGDNLLLAAPGTTFSLGNGFGFRPAQGNVGVIGADVDMRNLGFPDVGGLIVIGDGARLTYADVAASRGGTVLIGEHTTARWYVRVDGRNGGAVIVGADGMWSPLVNVVTDDMHTIRDVETGRRVNGFGGRIVIERHVWLGEKARITGGARIGADTVVGLGSVVGKTALPPNSVCAGAPCRPIRTGTTWTREDLP